MSENCSKCEVEVYCTDKVIEALRWCAEHSNECKECRYYAVGCLDKLLSDAADQLGNAKKQVASDQAIIEAQARRIQALYERVKELEGAKGG